MYNKEENIIKTPTLNSKGRKNNNLNNGLSGQRLILLRLQGETKYVQIGFLYVIIVNLKFYFIKIKRIVINQNEEIIAAISTPIGVGAISVIRISGCGCLKKVDEVFRGKKNLSLAKANTIHYGKIVNKKEEVLDDVLVSVFKKPNSYTGEESAEISTHGNPLITQKILELLLSQEIRLAEPGEFTKRAFLNGKIDLSQAEAVVDIINSRTNASLKGARNQLEGQLSKKVNSLREMLVNVSSLIELELDFAEEELEFISYKEVEKKLDNIIEELRTLVDSYKVGRIIKDGVNVALVGKPNVGKSSILNFILNESRAIVSHIPGTTRDVIREEVSIDGILFRLFDTAGIRITDNEVEKEGVDRSRIAIKNADVVVMIREVGSELPKNLYKEILELTKEEKIIKVVNKIDIKEPQKLSDEYLISAKTGQGMKKFFKALKEKSFGSEIFSEKSAVVTNVRHKDALNKAIEFLVEGKKAIAQKLTGEFIAVDLRNAENALGEIIGKVTSDDILNNIFSQFCIGK